MPEAIVSERDPKLTGKFWQELKKKVGTKLKMSTSAHPQMDGQSEVTNKTASTSMRIFAEDNPADWAARTPDVKFPINSATSLATSLSPFEGLYGFVPTIWLTSTWPVADNFGAEGFAECSCLNWLRATNALIASRVEMVTSANKKRH